MRRLSPKILGHWAFGGENVHKPASFDEQAKVAYIFLFKRKGLDQELNDERSI